jgi:AraC-like DNA-binding protein
MYPSTWIVKRPRRSPRKNLPLGVMVYQGEGLFKIGDRKFRARKDDLFIYFPGTEHRIQSASDKWGYCWISFDHADCVQWLKGFGFHEGKFHSCSCPRHLFTQVSEAILLRSLEGECQAALVAHEILVRASQGMEPAPDSLMLQAKHRMDEGLADPNLTVQSLADELGMHRSTLFRLFRKQYGVTPNDYLKQLRLHQALQMVQQGNNSIQDIAFFCGYSDPYYLSRLVKQHLGRSVKEMRRVRKHEPANPPR